MQFVDIGSRECYVGMLYTCYDLLRLDLIMEISWRHGLNDFTMVGLFVHTFFFLILIYSLHRIDLVLIALALHDQLHESTSHHDRSTSTRQRGKEGARGFA